ncbi:hypothetical protein JHK86_042940 [Glycine max]|nr:hypothetical protein JHK86_042940 [Glycine max]
MAHYTNHLMLLFLATISFFSSTFSKDASSINVLSFGAKPNGKFDSTTSFLKAWSNACKSKESATFYVPKGNFLIKQVTFEGPCSNNIKFRIDGTIVAPSDYRSHGNSGMWIMFRNLNGFSVQGGTFDGKGDSYWRCRKSGSSCPAGARSITFSSCNDVKVSGLTSLNSQAMHIAVDHCKNILFKNVKIDAPSTSPNTDGFNVILSTGVTVSQAIISTGDDCIALSQGNTNVWIEHITCGPGHGISIGSLGAYKNEAGVHNVTVTDSIFEGTQNGVRIKSWAQPSNGYASNIVFRNLTMKNANNPIIIDQNYCPGDKSCPHQSSGVKISKVSYEHIRGTSACPQAINLDCSKSNPCEGIKLQDIDLVYGEGSTTSTCNNVGGINSGVVIPKTQR